jgi:hypothetical protein
MGSRAHSRRDIILYRSILEETHEAVMRVIFSSFVSPRQNIFETRLGMDGEPPYTWPSLPDPQDLNHVHRETRFMVGCHKANPVLRPVPVPAHVTAHGGKDSQASGSGRGGVSGTLTEAGGMAVLFHCMLLLFVHWFDAGGNTPFSFTVEDAG